MILLAAAIVLAAAPRAHPAAHLSVYVPRLDRLEGVSAFMRAAGQRSALLHPSSWRTELHPLLYLDATDPAALAAAGLDPSGSATLSYVGDAKVSCTTLSDPKRFVERVSRRLAAAGEPWKSSAGGVPLLGASTGGRVVVGYALKGKQACAVQGQGSSVAVILEEVAKLVSKPSSGPEWARVAALPGAAFVVDRHAAAGFKGTAQSLTASGQLAGLALPALQPSGPSPYAGAPATGLAFLRARIAAEGRGPMGRTLLAQVLDVCQACEPGELAKVADAVLPRLTGEVMLRVDGVKVRESLRSRSGRYFAVRHAWVAEVSHASEVKAGLDRMGTWKAAKKTGDGWALSTPGGEVLVGLRGEHLYLGNDLPAVNAALEGLSGRPGSLAHGADFVVNPQGVARGLSQIPLLDVLGSQELAALFAAGTELGPLLAASERIYGWADSARDGAHSFGATWVLKPPAPPRPSPDAGAADAGAP